jgi:D-glycero-D-manno-heptose 1,7-bisphosphate phosphatase
LKEAGFSLVVVTNQGGISKGLYDANAVRLLHQKLQESCGYLLDFLIYAPLHREYTKSLASKPGSLMMERGLALTNSDPDKSWLIGDAERDCIAGKNAGVKTILLPTLKEQNSAFADHVAIRFSDAVDYILSQSSQ